MRKRQVRKYSNGWVIRLLQNDIIDLGIEQGDMIDLDDCMVIKNGEKKCKKFEVTK